MHEVSPGTYCEGVVSRQAKSGLDSVAEPLQAVQPLPHSGIFLVWRLPVGLYGGFQPIQHFVHSIQVEHLGDGGRELKTQQTEK